MYRLLKQSPFSKQPIQIEAAYTPSYKTVYDQRSVNLTYAVLLSLYQNVAQFSYQLKQSLLAKVLETFH